jgi:oligoribonuclease (3'-5' exoribonuclease)
VLILDTETTGLDWRAESIIELAMSCRGCRHANR